MKIFATLLSPFAWISTRLFGWPPRMVRPGVYVTETYICTFDAHGNRVADPARHPDMDN